MIMRKTAISFLALATVLALSACETTGLTSKADTNGDDKIAGAMVSAANDAAGNGRLDESLMINEKLYRDNPNNKEYILGYARDLRRSGRIDDAKLVIRTPAKDKKASDALMTECAMVLIAEGSYAEAVEFANGAVKKAPKSPDAHQALALALSGLGQHAEAEREFNTALSVWPEGRDQTPIINNLAMSQAAQGRVADARTTMAMATGEALRSEVYQNNRSFLSTLADKPVAEKLPDMVVEQHEETMVVKPDKKPGDEPTEVKKPVKIDGMARPVKAEPRAPKPEAPKADAPKVEAPKAEAVKMEELEKRPVGQGVPLVTLEDKKAASEEAAVAAAPKMAPITGSKMQPILDEKAQ